MRRLPPLREHPDHWRDLEDELRRWIRDNVYLPLVRSVSMKSQPTNSLSDLVAAIAAGEIQYVNGHFEGKLSATLSRELKKIGAIWDKSRKWWALPAQELRKTELADVRVAIGTSYSKFQAMAEKAKRTLDEMNPDQFAPPANLETYFDAAVFKMDREFKENVKRIGVVPELGEGVKKAIARDYSSSTKLDIRGWARDEITRLRKRVEENTFEYGLRSADLQAGIEKKLLAKEGLRAIKPRGLAADVQKSYQQVARKARFLARQETSLLLAKFQKARYLDAGIPRYEWGCVNNPPGPKNAPPVKHAVRWDHWELRGKIFRWDSPPVVDKRTGRRAHPKEDFNCRCTAIPIME